VNIVPVGLQLGLEKGASVPSMSNSAGLWVNRQLRFVLGVIVGFVLGIVLIALSNVVSQPLVSDATASSLTFVGIGLGIVGYIHHRRGSQSLFADFFFGFGVGIVVVSFLGAGNGTLSFM